MRRLSKWLASATGLLLAGSGLAESGGPVEKRTYYSAGRVVSVEVDPRWDEQRREWDPRLTMRRRWTTMWEREPRDFADFDYPLDVEVSDDGRWLVFGGYSAHNIINDPDYREGLRFYDSRGKLVRFVSRRDLPVPDYGISTAAWYDATRTRLRGTELEFFTPRLEEPLIFDVTTGELIRGRLVPGQGDDSHHDEWLRRLTGESPSAAEHPAID